MERRKEALIYSQDITKDYKVGKSTLRVLDKVSLEICKGDILIILGPSGAGKSTLLHIFGLLDTPTSGQVIYRGENLSRLSAKQQAERRNRHFGFVFQFYHLLPDFTALENVMMPRLIGRTALPQTDNKTNREMAAEFLDLVGLKDRASHRPDQLSGGERQRAAFARALVNEPEVLFCDEPTGNLDMKNSKDIQDLILRLNAQNDQTFIIVTHDENFARLGKRRIRLVDGRIVDQSTTAPQKGEG
ncbi:MAG: ABC transporter ATP-binding protein [Candidatus Brocadiales bacterium]|nr:ABC transporter ATP-binding protein [Candidatus Bathyanammoxibius sp.]